MNAAMMVPRGQHLLRLPLSRTGNVRLIVGIVIANLVMLVGTYLAHTFWPRFGWPLDFLGGQLDLGKENNVSVWYSSMLLLATALVMVGCYVVDARASRTRSDRLLAGGWLFCASVFGALSFDELGSIHERLEFIASIPSLAALPGWTGVLAVPMGLVAAFLLWFGWARLRTEPRTLALFVAGTAIYLSVPIQEHLEWIIRTSAGGSGAGARPAGFLLMEEGTELFGTLAFLAAALTYARSRLSETEARDGEIAFALDARWTTALVGLAAAAALAGAAWLGGLVSVDDNRGIPQHWPPAAVSAIVAAVAAIEAGRRRKTGGASLAPLAIAVLMTMLSADHGSAHWASERLWDSMPARRIALDALLGAMVLGVVALVWRDPRLREARTALTIWAAFVFWGVTAEGLTGILLASAGYLTALGGLLRTLAGVAAGPAPAPVPAVAAS